MTNFPSLLEALTTGGVEFIIIGGIAATAHGSAHVTRGLNFTLVTALGDLDVIGEATGGGTYDALLPHSEARPLFGRDVRFVELETLIRLKRAAGRPKDLERIAELEAILEERRKT